MTVLERGYRVRTTVRSAGQRFLGTGLGPAADKVPTREIPDLAVRFAARFTDHSLREIAPALGRRNRHSTEKARHLLGAPRPAAETVVDCGRSLLDPGAVPVG